MLSHVMVGSNDIARSKTFYDTLLGSVFGAPAAFVNQANSGHTRLFYRHAGSSFCVSEPIDDAPASPGNGTTVGFVCDSPGRYGHFMMRRLPQVPPVSKSRLACVTAPWGRSGWRMCATRMATNSAPSIGRRPSCNAGRVTR